MPGGGSLRLSTWATDHEVVVTVQDSGVGMSPRVRSRVFDPFFTTKGEHGSGLGLSVAYTVVARHRGQIVVDSEEGHGTTVTIRLPRVAPFEAARRARADGSSEGGTTPSPARKGRVLAVDDEPELGAMLARILQNEGHYVRVSSKGADALALLRQESFDLLLTDISMPEMDGWEVARRAKEAQPRLLVGLMTGWGLQFEGIDLTANGIDFLLSKPFTVSAARALVARALSDSASEQI
jgi:CheY-like chemotaxis protein